MLLLLLLSLIAQPATGATEHDLGEEEIIGEAEALITDKKPFSAPQFDPFSPVNELLSLKNYIFDEALAHTVDSMTVPHRFIESSYLRVPVERDFAYSYIIVFFPTFEKQVAHWELDIANSFGETVRNIAQRGHPPASIPWDGRDNNGRPVAIGDIYSFTFNAYDTQGNRTRLPGTPRRINAMVSRDDTEVIIAIAADRIFVEGSGRLLDDAADRLDEAANIIRENFNSELTIYVYTEQERLTTDRCNVIRDQIAERLVLPQGAMTVTPRFIPGLRPRFSKLEILVR